MVIFPVLRGGCGLWQEHLLRCGLAGLQGFQFAEIDAGGEERAAEGGITVGNDLHGLVENVGAHLHPRQIGCTPTGAADGTDDGDLLFLKRGVTPGFDIAEPFEQGLKAHLGSERGDAAAGPLGGVEGITLAGGRQRIQELAAGRRGFEGGTQCHHLWAAEVAE